MKKSQATVAKHSSATVEHYSPHKIVDAARELMGGTIDLDPASCEQANRDIVRALRFHSKEDDGLAHEWHGTVWMNPPGGRVGNRSLTKMFWSKLVDEWTAERVSQAVFLGFNLEVLQTTQAGCARSCLSFPLCIPKQRIAFLYVDPGEPGLFGPPGSLKVGGSPTHANVLVWLPPSTVLGGGKSDGEHFVEAFSWLGECRT